MDAAPAARLHLDMVIAPVRSLPVKGFAILFGALLAANLLIGTLFFVLGAWPAPIFLGLDLLAVGLAFRANYRQARTSERVQVSAEQVRVLREAGASSHTVWASPTAFTRVDLEHSGRYGPQVRLMLSGKRVTIGSVLGPKAREDLAEAVDQAIRSARAERWEG